MSINEKALCALIKKQPYAARHIVNVKEDNFEYCNGYMMAVCNYSCHDVIQQLFKIEAINNYRDWKAKTTYNLKQFYACKNEVVAEKTPYLKIVSGELANIFKINGKHYIYNKKYVDVFKDACFKADIEPTIPLLRVYDDDIFIGVILAIRDRDSENTNSVILDI